MYSDRHVARRLAAAADEFRERHASLGLKEFVHHTPAEVDEFEERLRKGGKYVLDKDNVPVSLQNLSVEEVRRIENESIVSACDAAYAVTRYGWLTDQQGVITRFGFRVAQKMLFDIIADLEDRDSAIEIMILKARQLGMTTLVTLLILLRVMFRSGVNSVIASADIEKSRMMAKKLFAAYDKWPIWMRPTTTARVEGERGRMEFAQIESGVSIQHGNQMSGIARGSTPTIYHLSECASFSNPSEQIDASLFRAVHASPNVFGILESTGEGDEGWWPDTWRLSKAKWPNCRLYPLFLPWFAGLDLYPTETWLSMHPVPERFYEHRLDDTREHVAKSEAYCATHPIIKRHLCLRHPELGSRKQDWWADGRMPIEQQWFWEVNHEESKDREGSEATFFQEMAGDDIEALQRSSESVFGYETMKEVDDNRVRDYTAFAITGQSVEDIHEPDTSIIDYAQDRVPVVFRSPINEASYKWELIPLKVDHQQIDFWKTNNPDAFWEYAHSRLFIFHPPRPGVDYSIGIDTSNGQGDDSTVINVTELAPRPGMPDVQAAEFRSAYVSHVGAYAFAMAIATYYASAMTEMHHTQPIVAAEQVMSVGDVCTHQMRKMGYQRFFVWRRMDVKNPEKQKSNKVGWFTFGWSRPILMGNFTESLRNGWYELNSPWTIYECEHFERHKTKAGKIKEEHADDFHDDGIFASAISIQIARGLQSLTERSKKRFQGGPALTSLPNVDTRPYRRLISTTPQKPVDLSDLM